MAFQNNIAKSIVPAIVLLLMAGGRATAAVSSPVLPGNITTFAGTGNWGYSGDGHAATQADLQMPIDITFDVSGNLFMADSINEVIRRVDATTGVITTVAGKNRVGFSGDGGPATSASLSSPAGLAVDSSGNLYISDSDNNRVRRVNHQTGIITTFAGSESAGFGGDGGPAIGAALNGPAGLAVDSSGNLYISDSHNNAIRKVDATTGVITTVAGGGSPALFNTPLGIALDGVGNLYVADSQDSSIRKVVLSTGAVSTRMRSSWGPAPRPMPGPRPPATAPG